eukprot:TRINITY_DN14426_c0_g2_i1.p1 TRINITY_DN14426_c0_g2~~TRINITY_DN14426_c0_g2_i1.p1  ORF type:complete len:1114 (-),score=120.94 TRINITY_DN14426_c0_g2_i1:691-4032(-)
MGYLKRAGQESALLMRRNCPLLVAFIFVLCQVSAAADECRSKVEQHLLWGPSSHQPSLALQQALEKYADFHAKCRAEEGSDRSAFRKFLLQENSTLWPPLTCQYLVWSPLNDGLATSILSLVSAFALALSTERVLLLDSNWEIGNNFCEPFSKSSWLLPMGIENEPMWVGERATSVNVWLQSVEETAIDVLLPPEFPVIVSLQHSEARDSKAFCSSQFDRLSKARVLLLRGDQYFAPSLYLTSLKSKLESLFPDNHVFTPLARYLLNPVNSTWDRILSFRNNASFSSVAEIVGMQIRSSHRHERTAASLKHCVDDTDILPRAAKGAQGQTVSVLLAATHSKVFHTLQQAYEAQGVENGTLVTVHRAMEHSRQSSLNPAHMGDAIVDIWLLSSCHKLITSASSAAGYIAAGLMGKQPYQLTLEALGDSMTPEQAAFALAKKEESKVPCPLAPSPEPCYHRPPRTCPSSDASFAKAKGPANQPLFASCADSEGFMLNPGPPTKPSLPAGATDHSTQQVSSPIAVSESKTNEESASGGESGPPSSPPPKSQATSEKLDLVKDEGPQVKPSLPSASKDQISAPMALSEVKTDEGAPSEGGSGPPSNAPLKAEAIIESPLVVGEEGPPSSSFPPPLQSALDLDQSPPGPLVRDSTQTPSKGSLARLQSSPENSPPAAAAFALPSATTIADLYSYLSSYVPSLEASPPPLASGTTVKGEFDKLKYIDLRYFQGIHCEGTPCPAFSSCAPQLPEGPPNVSACLNKDLVDAEEIVTTQPMNYKGDDKKFGVIRGYKYAGQVYILTNVFMSGDGMVFDDKNYYEYGQNCGIPLSRLDIVFKKLAFAGAFEELASLVYGYGNNYYHSMLESTLALELLQPLLKERPKLPLAHYKNQMFTTFELLEVSPESLNLKSFDRRTFFFTRTLILPTTTSCERPSKAFIDLIRRKYLHFDVPTSVNNASLAESANEGHEVQSIKRGPFVPADWTVVLAVRPKDRRILGWEDLLVKLAVVFLNRKIEIWHGNSTFAETRRLFSTARFLLATHGAGLANLIFMPPYGEVLEIVPTYWSDNKHDFVSLYRYLAYTCDITYNALIANGTKYSDLDIPHDVVTETVREIASRLT